VCLEEFPVASKIRFLGHQLGLSDESVFELLGSLEQIFMYDRDFLGNPHHLQIISQFDVDANESQMFEFVAAVLHSLVCKALIKIESVGKSSHLLNTKIKLRQRLLVAAAAQLEGLGYCNVLLTPEKTTEINNVGILNINLDQENQPLFKFSYVTFKCFFLACACLVRDMFITENQIQLLLEKKCERSRDEIIFFVKRFVDSYQIMHQRDSAKMSSLMKTLTS
jgi:hypothetical protein